MITKNTFVVTIITVLGILFGTSCEKKIQASTSSGDGHVWVIDGYEFIPSMSFTGQYFHINWGWHGERDGYYNMGVFNTINGQFANSTYDNLSQLNMGNNMNFTWDFAIIDY